MTRSALLRLVTALAILIGSVLVAAGASPKLGLDLRGGTQIVLETSDSATTKANAESTDRTVEVLRGRVDALGVSEPTLVRSGERRIIVELPGLKDSAKAADVIGKTAQLSFHPVIGIDPAAQEQTPDAAPEDTAPEDAAPEDTAPEDTAGPRSDKGSASKPAAPNARDARPADPNAPENKPATGSATGSAAEPAADGSFVLPDEDGTPLQLGKTAVPGTDVKSADAAMDPASGTGWTVDVAFRGDGGTKWRNLTGQAACSAPGDPARRVAIVLDDKIISSPQVDESIQCEVGMAGGSTQISGNFTAETAKDLAILIEGGALPVPVEIIEQRFVGPTLGADAIDASFKAALIGLALTGLFIMFVYRLSGLLATIALVGYAVISYAALTLLGATLTLPGLAGFVLAIGMAIDANVLVFERAKDAMGPSPATDSGDAASAQRRPNVHRALLKGFKHAWTAIIDSNVTTLLAATLLFFLASGTVKGFGVTLSIGVLASMISALIVCRVLTEAAMKSTWVQAHPKVTGLTGGSRVRDAIARRNPNIMGRSKTWLSVSALALVLAVCGIALNGLNLGVEFTGGRLMEYKTAKTVSVDIARQAVADAGFPTAVVQSSGDGIAVRASRVTNDEQAEITEALTQVAGKVSLERDELIGPSLGSELRTKALIAFMAALALQMIYLAIRFRWVFGASAVAAMFHDVVIVTGIFAWLGKPIDGIFLAAVLTIVGLSVNDSVVVFDRIRETWRGAGGAKGFTAATNDAVLATIPRTINTGLGAMFILAALAVLGGDSLRDFAIALLLGLIIGTYSSMFFASPLAVVMNAKWPVAARTTGPKTRAAAVRRELEDSGAVV